MVPPQNPQRIISPSSAPTDIFIGQQSFFLFGLYPLLWSADHISMQHFQDSAADVALRKRYPQRWLASGKATQPAPKTKKVEQKPKISLPSDWDSASRNSVSRKSLKETWVFSV